MQTQQYLHHLPMWNGYIIDARIAWWKIQSRRQVIVLIVTGELDASNAGRLHQSVRGIASTGDPFVVDLCGVTFVGAQCIRTLLALDAQCRATRTRWALVTNSTVRSVLDVADPGDLLPETGSLSEALREVVAAKGTILRIAPRPRRRERPLDR